ncbi:hypothetical protein Ddye_029336 [Dipteronia dyeriana]|uniref:RRM domain-containing protein n=1 Tax=Dipteronia dyeriana TaxID=168575 RepID=A0AAD9WKH6_9ROSI|nr:hypothetical protein Ddye_029336 [Dipteronia dyeriana]
MDSVCLLGLFKTFGKVRNVFLSAENSSRRSRFAFIRFEIVNEAIKVAKTTNGMHVYSWPIVTKLAEFGRDKRNFSESKTSHVVGIEKELKQGSKRFQTKMVFEKGRSFTKVARGSQKNRSVSEEKMVKKQFVMTWEIRQNDKEWLNRCAVSILIDFTPVNSVNKRQQDKGFGFSLTYLGYKGIL